MYTFLQKMNRKNTKTPNVGNFLQCFPWNFQEKSHFLLSAPKPVSPKNGIKSWSGGLRPKFLAIPCDLTESSSKMILGSEGDQWFLPFFRFSISEISTTSEKKCFREVHFVEKTTVLFFWCAPIVSNKNMLM